jgi:hypothetical protein
MKKFIITALAFAPSFAFAQVTLNNTKSLTSAFGQLVNSALPILVGLALLAFFWGLVKFIFSAGDAEKAKEGKSIMIYGIIALVVMVSVWGIVNFIASDLGVSNGTAGNINTPTVNSNSLGSY